MWMLGASGSRAPLSLRLFQNLPKVPQIRKAEMILIALFYSQRFAIFSWENPEVDPSHKKNAFSHTYSR